MAKKDENRDIPARHGLTITHGAICDNLREIGWYPRENGDGAMTEPRTIYTQLLTERRTDISAREKRHKALGYGRLATVAAAAAIVWQALGGRISIAWVMIPFAVFVVLLVIHDRLLECWSGGAARSAFSSGRWRGWTGAGQATAKPGERYIDPAHLTRRTWTSSARRRCSNCCARRARTSARTRWRAGCCGRADPAVVRARQQAVEELRGRLDLREDLAVVAEEARTGVDPVSLAAWGEAPAALQSAGPTGALLWAAHRCWGRWPSWRCGPGGLHRGGLLDVLRLAGARCCATDSCWSLVANGCSSICGGSRSTRVVAAVEEAAHELALLSEVLVRLERERFTSPLLAELRAALDAEGDPPSRRLARLKRLIEHLDSRDNVFVRVLEPFILWTPHLAVRVEHWRRHSGPAVRRWLNATGEMEALCSLAQPRLRASRRSVPGDCRRTARCLRPRPSATRCCPKIAWCATTSLIGARGCA